MTNKHGFYSVNGAMYLTIDNIEFTARWAGATWSFAGEDNWQRVVDESERLGIDPDHFWPTYEPLLDKIVDDAGYGN